MAIMTQELTPKALELIEVLRGADKWLDRSEIANILGKNRLNPHEIKVLDGLADTGQVSRDTETIGIRDKYLYRIED